MVAAPGPSVTGAAQTGRVGRAGSTGLLDFRWPSVYTKSRYTGILFFIHICVETRRTYGVFSHIPQILLLIIITFLTAIIVISKFDTALIIFNIRNEAQPIALVVDMSSLL